MSPLMTQTDRDASDGKAPRARRFAAPRAPAVRPEHQRPRLYDIALRGHIVGVSGKTFTLQCERLGQRFKGVSELALRVNDPVVFDVLADDGRLRIAVNIAAIGA